MKSDLVIHNIPHHSPEWYEFRKRGIGGSEIGSLLIPNKYNSPLLIFMEKIGARSIIKPDNEAMFHGRELEDYIATIWEYYDGSVEGMIANRAKDSVVRKNRKVNGYITNPKYPWLFFSADRLINEKGGFKLLPSELGVALNGEGYLECKQISHWASQIWESGIPPYYLLQVQQGMLVMELEYAELAVLKDGNKFEVYPIEMMPATRDMIVEKSRDFWYNRVLPVQQAAEKMQNGQLNYAEYEALVNELQPDPSESEAEKEYFNENFRKERDEVMVGKPEENVMARHILISEAIRQLESEKSLLDNTMRNRFNQERVEMMNSPNGFKATMKVSTGHKNPTLRITGGDKTKAQLKAEEMLRNGGLLL